MQRQREDKSPGQARSFGLFHTQGYLRCPGNSHLLRFCRRSAAAATVYEAFAMPAKPRKLLGSDAKTLSPAGHEEKLVGAVRFELTTSCTRNKRATRLRYAPTPGTKRVPGVAQKSNFEFNIFRTL